MLRFHPVIWYCVATWSADLAEGFAKFAHCQGLVLEWVEAEAEAGAEADCQMVWSSLLNSDQMVQFLLGRGTGHGDGTELILGDGRGVFLGVGTGLFLGGGTGVVLWGGTGVFLGGGFPLGVVDPGPPIDVSKGFGVLAPRPGPGWGVLPECLEIALNMSAFLKSFLKYASSVLNNTHFNVKHNTILNHGVRRFWIYWTFHLLNHLELNYHGTFRNCLNFLITWNRNPG